MKKPNQLRFATLALLVALSGAAQSADNDIVVITNLSAGALTQEQVADIYLGKNQSLVPLDQGESSPIRAIFYPKVTGRGLTQIKATWSRLVFSGKGVAPKELPDSAAVKKAVAADTKAIGYIEKSAVDSTVKVVLTLE